MEIGYILNELWRRRLWVAIGVVVAVFGAATVVFRIPSFEKKSFELGTAATEVLVDAPRSPLGALNSDVVTLVTRAQLYASLMESEPVKDRIAKELGYSPGTLATRGPQPGVEVPGTETSSGERSAELLTEASRGRLFAVAAAEIPIVSITTQADTAEKAIKLADAGAAALAGYVRDIQERQQIAPSVRTQIRQLGAAKGGVVNSGVNKVAAVLTFFGAFGFWCVLIILATRTNLSWRAARGERDDGQRSGPDGPAANGSSDREEANARLLAARPLVTKAPADPPQARR